MKKIMIALMLGILLISSVNSLTEEERVRNNALIEQKQATGEIGAGKVPPLYKTPKEVSIFSQISRTIEMNPFIVIGVLLVLIIILIGIIIAFSQKDPRL